MVAYSTGGVPSHYTVYRQTVEDMNWKSNLTVAVVTMAHVLEIRQIENRQVLSGGEGMLLKAILEALGFEYDLVVPDDKEFGRLDENGEWTGLIGMVSRSEVDLACNAIVVTYQRSEAVEFSTTYGAHSRTFAIEKARPTRSRKGYLYPFSPTVWTCFMAVIVAVSVVQWLIFNDQYCFGRVLLDLTGHILRQPMTLLVNRHQVARTFLGMLSRNTLGKCPEPVRRRSSCKLSGNTMNKCCGNVLKKLSGNGRLVFRELFMPFDKISKINLSLWTLYSVVISSCYTCALLSAMAVPMNGKTVETFQELAEAVRKGTHRCFGMKGSYSLPFLTSAGELHLQELGRTIEEKEWYYTASDMSKEDVIDLNTAQIGSQFDLELYHGSDEHETNIFISRDFLSTHPVGIAVSSGFCCKKRLNDIISRFVSTGLVDKIYGDAAFQYRLRTHKLSCSRSKCQSLSVEDISGTMIILIVGHSLAFLAFLGEVVWN